MSKSGVKLNSIMVKNDSGKFKIVTDAINSYSKKNQDRLIIYFKVGIYNKVINNVDIDDESILIFLRVYEIIASLTVKYWPWSSLIIIALGITPLSNMD